MPPANTSLIVYLIGNTSDKLAFLKTFDEIEQKFSMRNEIQMENVCMVFHKNINFHIVHNLFLTKVGYLKYSTNSNIWQTMNIDDVEDRACDENFYTICIGNASSLLYLNATFDNIKKFEALKNKEFCTSYNYKSEDFADSLNFLENIAPVSGSVDELHDVKQSLFFCAQAGDSNSLPGILPNEVAHIISNIYATLSNRSILMFKPQCHETPPAQLVLNEKIERVTKQQKIWEESRVQRRIEQKPVDEQGSLCSIQ